MLVLNRKRGQRIVIGDMEIVVSVERFDGKEVRIGIVAPKDKPIYREEVYVKIKQQLTDVAANGDAHGAD